MATIERREGKNGVTWRVKIRMRGAAPINATFRRRTDAVTYVRRAEAEIAEGRYSPGTDGRRHTLSEAIARYISQRRPEPQVRQQLGWWRERIGHLRLAGLSRGVFVEQRDILAITRSPATVNRYMSALRHCLSLCVGEWGWIPRHPMEHVSGLREPRGRIRFLDEDECERLLAACRVSPRDHLYPVVMLALCTGCRKREITELEWSRVARDYTAITLLETKNDKPRRIPIVEPALTVLREHGRTRRVVGCDWVFPGRGMSVPCDITRAWQAARTEAGLEDFRFHDLRHTAASYLAMSGASLLEIAEILGHKQLQMVQRYAHLSEPAVRETLSRAMGKFLG